MSCIFYQSTLRTGRMPISAIYDFDEPSAAILLGDEKEKKQVGNPVVPSSELPNEEFDEKAEDEQGRRDDDPKEKPNL
jgi:hypothetical protein